MQEATPAFFLFYLFILICIKRKLQNHLYIWKNNYLQSPTAERLCSKNSVLNCHLKHFSHRNNVINRVKSPGDAQILPKLQLKLSLIEQRTLSPRTAQGLSEPQALPGQSDPRWPKTDFWNLDLEELAEWELKSMVWLMEARVQLSKHFMTISKSNPDGSGSGGLKAVSHPCVCVERGSAYLEG